MFRLMKTMLTLVWFFSSSSNAAGVDSEVVCIQPLSSPSERHLFLAERTMELFFGLQTKRLATEQPPAEAYVADRNRYQVETLHDHFFDTVDTSKQDCHYLLLLTEVDLGKKTESVGAYGMIGAAHGSYMITFISSYRMRFLSRAGQERFMVKTVLHEMAHLLGAAHHKDSSCLMAEFARSLNHTEITLCEESRRIMEDRLGKSLPNTKILEQLFTK